MFKKYIFVEIEAVNLRMACKAYKIDPECLGTCHRRVSDATSMAHHRILEQILIITLEAFTEGEEANFLGRAIKIATQKPTGIQVSFKIRLYAQFLLCVDNVGSVRVIKIEEISKCNCGACCVPGMCS